MRNDEPPADFWATHPRFLPRPPGVVGWVHPGAENVTQSPCTLCEPVYEEAP